MLRVAAGPVPAYRREEILASPVKFFGIYLAAFVPILVEQKNCDDFAKIHPRRISLYTTPFRVYVTIHTIACM